MCLGDMRVDVKLARRTVGTDGRRKGGRALGNENIIEVHGKLA